MKLILKDENIKLWWLMVLFFSFHFMLWLLLWSHFSFDVSSRRWLFCDRINIEGTLIFLLLLSGSSCLQTSSPTVLSVSDDRHVNGDVEGKPCAGVKQNGGRGRASPHVRFTGAVSLRRPLPVSCWMLVEWPKLTRFYNTKVTWGCVIHLSWAVFPLDARHREVLCRIKQGFISLNHKHYFSVCGC